MTAELTRAAERSTTRSTRGELRGTVALVRLALRRDRWLLPSWIAAFALIPASSAAATAGLYPDRTARIAAANTINATAAIVALYGRIYDPSSLGVLALLKPAVFGRVAVAIVVVMLVVRHTRAEEESGRLELVEAGVVGRTAPLTAALLVAGGACLLLGLLTAFALVAAGLPVAGAVTFGAGWAATGMCFAAVAAVAAQLTAAARAATGLGLMSVGVAYLLRAVGDLAEAGHAVGARLAPPATGPARLGRGARRAQRRPGFDRAQRRDGIVAATRLRAEETAGHVEVLLAGVPDRGQLAGSHAVIALGGVAGLLHAAGVAAGVGHGLAIGDPSQVVRVAAAACARIPAAWVVVGLVMVVWGGWPRATSAVWALYVAFLIVGEVGPVWGLPGAVIDLSPFAHSPLLPGTDVGLASLGWLTALAAVLVASGIGAFRRRDLTP